MKGLSEKKLGILILENNPFGDIYGTNKMTIMGSMGNPATFRFPVIYETVPGATGDRVVGGDKTLLEQYVLTAKRLVNRGAVLLTTNCGFTILFQKDLAEAVPIPIITSSLTLIPFVSNLISRDGQIGVITFDKKSLLENYFLSTGIDIYQFRLVVEGLSEKGSWKKLNDLKPMIDPEMMREDLLDVCRGINQRHPKLEAVILECTALPQFRRDVGSIFKVPVFDIIDTVHFVMNSLS
jgi:hypothetical protein